MNSDLRASVILDRETNENYPAFSAFARNAKGEITGVQVVYLNSQTCDKADISVPRRAFGKIIANRLLELLHWHHMIRL
ncbi:hypothetical protein [Orientia tsutsugamushi]|uniref:DUF7146 domain-containing protein n=1 Tax=Orientia tsutsugamushi TaxID=784 RepID=UPI0005A019F2|nr:hypothetical protein [Orientia tsutsugamushi]